MASILWIFLFSGLIAQSSTSQYSIASIIDEEIRVPIEGRICAYADIDKDRLTDLIVQKGSTLLVMPQSETGMFKADDSKKFKNITLDSDKPVFCSVGDFDGDASVDIMVVTPHKESRNFFGGGGVDRYKVDIYYLEAKEFQRYPLNYTFFDHPSVLDLNGDGVSDIIGFTVDTETETVTYPLYCRQGTRTIGGLVKCDEKFKNFKYPAHPLPNFSPIFADIDDDMVPEIIFGFIEDERLVISIWHVIDDDYNWQEKAKKSGLPGNPEVKQLGGPIIGDFNADSLLDILIPVCDYWPHVTHFVALTYKDENWRWVNVLLDMNSADLIAPSDETRVIFRAGDFSLDGYPDLITTAKNGNEILPLILSNVEYSGAGNNFNRKFEVTKGPSLIKPSEMAKGIIQLTSFFDLKEDGNLDIIIEYNKSDAPKIDFIKCDDKGDTTFLKVQIFSNVCTLDCPPPQYGPPNSEGSGIPWHGACVAFSMSDSNVAQGMRYSKQCQLTQTSHRVLQNPYALFGLGRSPNFVDEVVCATPRFTAPGTSPDSQRHTLPLIVPNSRILVIPPEAGKGVWLTRLYLTPSRLIILSLVILAAMCGILLLVIAILHYRERRHDLHERLTQTRRFHFVAM